ncbi:MAG: GrpB family protein [Planctomycetes bacterium]|nr:GrpB family protein [Planctomycetota bacterium]MCA8947141.1 GrpB family protein [Planctomycetota bacterium]
MSKTVKIVPYQAEWAEKFQRERERLAKGCGAALAAIEHIGSTSVPGLPAKPTVDIIACVGERALLSVIDEPTVGKGPVSAAGNSAHVALVDRICGLGYIYRGENGINGRLFFAKPAEHPREVHLHLVLKDSKLWREHLMFRDFLRAHADVAERYGLLKKQLATKAGADREAYTDGKSAFIRQCIKAAYSWQAAK